MEEEVNGRFDGQGEPAAARACRVFCGSMDGVMAGAQAARPAHEQSPAVVILYDGHPLLSLTMPWVRADFQVIPDHA